MHEPQLSLAVLPEPPVIYRVQLRPYTLGHELHLWRRANPYVTKSYAEFEQLPGNVQHAATLQAVNVCSRTYAQSCAGSGRWWKLWNFVSGFYSIAKATAAMWHHIDQGHSRFKAELPTTEYSGPPRFIGAPQILRLYQSILDNIPESERAFYTSHSSHRSHKSPFTAWDFPMALAIMLDQARAEDRGALCIHSWKEDIIEREIAKLDAAEAEAAAKTKEPQK